MRWVNVVLRRCVLSRFVEGCGWWCRVERVDVMWGRGVWRESMKW